MQTKDNRTNPAEITVSDQTFNRLTFIKLGDKSEKPRQYIYDGRGYKFVHYPRTGDARTIKPGATQYDAPEERQHFDASILFGAWDDADEKWFAFFSADCFDPPLYLVNGRSWEDAYESFTDEFIDAIKVDDWEHELKLEAMDLAQKARQAEDWRANPNGFDAAWDAMLNRDDWLSRAEAELTENGSVSYNPNGVPYWAEGINGFELSLVKAEKV